MKARATRTSDYEREDDGIFGRVERFVLKHEHRVQVQIGNAYFVSTKTYTSADAARRAAERLESAHDR